MPRGSGRKAVKGLVPVLLLPALLCGSSTPALAAEIDPLENGLKVGEGRLHPYLELESRSDSNVVLVPDTQLPEGDVILHIRPGFTLDVPSSTAAVHLSAEGDYLKYLGVQSPTTQKLDRIFATALAGLTFNKDGAVAPSLSGAFTRTDNTPNLLLLHSAIANIVDGRFVLAIQPGGRALVFEPGYLINYQRYDERRGVEVAGCGGDPTCASDRVGAFNRITHTAQLNARWKFFPKTAFVLDSSLGAAQFFQQSTFDSLNFKLQGGLQGLLTTRLSVIAKVGWGFQPGDGAYSSLIGHLEFAYMASRFSQLKLGYQRSYDAAPVPGAFYRDDGVYADGRVHFGSSGLALAGRAALDWVRFANSQADRLVSVSGGPEFRVTDWFIPSIGVAYTQKVGDSASVALSDDYHRVEAWLRLRFEY